MDYTHHMRQALTVAETALPEDIPVGAILLDPTGKVVAQAANQRERDHNPIAHAEILVLEQAGKILQNWRLNKCTLVVTLEPCPMCTAAILQARVSTVIFGAYDPLMGGMGGKYPLPPASKLTVYGGILEADCQQLLNKTFQALR